MLEAHTMGTGTIFWVNVAMLIGTLLGAAASYYVWKQNRKLDQELRRGDTRAKP